VPIRVNNTKAQGLQSLGFGVNMELMGTTSHPWNDWYHINGNTYGTWLPGDPRGWRTRHHRIHVEGDYKNPPPRGTSDGLHAYSKKLMKAKPVYLSPEARAIACCAMVEAFTYHAIELVAVAVDDHHYHILARFRDHFPRKWVGIAKKESARAISTANLGPSGGIWAVRCKVTPINDRDHQVTVARYIAKHAQRGAALWAAWK